MGSHWSSPDVQEWKKQALEKQQHYCLLLSDRLWEQYESSELELLQCKIAFACFGYPAKYSGTQDNLLSGYADEQKDKAKKICETIVGDSKSLSSVKVAFVFVCGKMDEKQFEEPVFRVCRQQNGGTESEVFVDTTGREYANWGDYLHTNVLPRCMYCYPTNGRYTYGGPEGRDIHTVDVSYGHSPACNTVTRLKEVLDVVAVVGTVAATGVVVASFFTPLGPAVAVIVAIGELSAAYTGGRAIGALVDRKQHDQSISPADAEARSAWIDLLSSVFGVSGPRTTAHMMKSARSGEVFGKAGRIAMKALESGKLTVNGFGIVNNLAYLVDRCEQDDLSALDVYHFTIAVFFYTHALMSVDTATTIITETQNELEAHGSPQLTEEHHTAFQRVLEDTRSERCMHGNARIDKSITCIENRSQFIRHLTKADEEESGTIRLKLTAEGQICVNDQLNIDPGAFIQMAEDSRNKAFVATAKLSHNQMSESEFLKEIENICKEEKGALETRRAQYIHKVAEAFAVKDLRKVKIKGKMIFRDLQAFELDRIASVLDEAGENHSPEMMKAATLFAETWGCDNPAQFCSLVEFLAKFCSDQTKSRYNSGQSVSIAAVKQQVLESLTDKRSQNFADLNREYTNLWKQAGVLNELSPFRFESNRAVTYHVYQHGDFADGDKLSPDRYLDVARELFGKDAKKSNVKLNWQGHCVKVTYIDRQRGLFGVHVQPYRILNDVVFVATVYYDKRYHNTSA